MQLIDYEKLIHDLKYWAFQEDPGRYGYDPDCKEYSALDMQRMVVRTIRDAISVVEEQPTIVQEESQWTPCSEGMPKKFGEMLVTTVPVGGILWAHVMIAHYSDLMGISKPCFWIGEVGKHSFRNITNRVTAWMPLPKPYKKGKDE